MNQVSRSETSVALMALGQNTLMHKYGNAYPMHSSTPKRQFTLKMKIESSSVNNHSLNKAIKLLCGFRDLEYKMLYCYFEARLSLTFIIHGKDLP